MLALRAEHGSELRDVVDDGAIVRTGLRHGNLEVVGHKDVAALFEDGGLNLTHHLGAGHHHRVGHVANLGLGAESGHGRVDVEHVDGLETLGSGGIEHAVLHHCCGHVEPALGLAVVDWGVELLESDDVLRGLGDFADSRSLGRFVTTLARGK